MGFVSRWKFTSTSRVLPIIRIILLLPWVDPWFHYISILILPVRYPTWLPLIQAIAVPFCRLVLMLEDVSGNWWNSLLRWSHRHRSPSSPVLYSPRRQRRRWLIINLIVLLPTRMSSAARNSAFVKALVVVTWVCHQWFLFFLKAIEFRFRRHTRPSSLPTLYLRFRSQIPSHFCFFIYVAWELSLFGFTADDSDSTLVWFGQKVSIRIFLQITLLIIFGH